VSPEELVRGVASFLRNRTAYRGLRELAERLEEHFDAELDRVALERANNVVGWLVMEYEVWRREK